MDSTGVQPSDPRFRGFRLAANPSRVRDRSLVNLTATRSTRPEAADAVI